MQFRLTYEGTLAGAHGRASDKHAIRKVFHKQLRTLWFNHPSLKDRTTPQFGESISWLEGMADRYRSDGFRWVPLVNAGWSLLCKLDILMLRPGPQGALITSGDIDNRLKTLFDALRKPNNAGELGGSVPESSEDPFFILLEDDRLVKHVSVETDTLLDDNIDVEIVKLVINVTTINFRIGVGNIDLIA